MAATNKLLAKRVDVLTDAFVEVHDDIREAIASGDTDALEGTREYIEDLIGLENADEGSGDEESEVELHDEEEEPEEE